MLVLFTVPPLHTTHTTPDMTTKLFKEVWIRVYPYVINSSKLRVVELNKKKISWKFTDDSGLETKMESREEALFKFEHLTKFLEAQDPIDGQAEKKWEAHKSWKLYADRSNDDPKSSPDPKIPLDKDPKNAADTFFKEKGKNEF